MRYKSVYENYPFLYGYDYCQKFAFHFFPLLSRFRSTRSASILFVKRRKTIGVTLTRKHMTGYFGCYLEFIVYLAIENGSYSEMFG